MKLLVTGAFGSVGVVTLREALSRGHEVTAFVRRSPHNLRTARKLRRRLRREGVGDSFTIMWGDVRDPGALEAAVAGQDSVIHLAAMLPPRCEAHPDLCEAINVGGTANLVAAMDGHRGRGRAASRADVPPRTDGHPGLVYASSVSVMGCTQHKEPPLLVDDPPCPSDTYSASKVAAEAVVRDSGLPWAILRLAAVMPTSGAYRVSMVRLMFDMALEARCEVVLDLDVAYALVEAAENLCDGGGLRGKTVFIAGGADQGCQMDIANMISRNLDPVGLKMPRPHLFRPDPDSYYLDWYDTAEGQALLGYQRHGVDDWQRLSFRRLRLLRWVLWPVRWLAGLYFEWVGRREARSLGR